MEDGVKLNTLKMGRGKLMYHNARGNPVRYYNTITLH